ncbi:ANTAR domain-containing protein [Streptomyces sp. NBC_01283]|uniref:ANTAR domain-containing protein n=1 Tax=Streptomyces sp. NBC_01283 TaxID=2903812 RepID=UPI00352E23E1|nr:ANTAR domain-containing protein [Streptomyces sp. NBC_01283]
MPDGTRVSVIVRGELDLETGERLRPDLLHALSGSAEGIDLYLSEVTFCDCSGTNLLLDLRRLALRDGKTVAVLSTSTAVERMFDLTATHDLFVPPELSGPPASDGEKEIGPADSETESAKDSEESLRTVISQLRRAMQTRPTIDLARGILMSVFGLSPEASWEVLVTASQNTNTKLHHLAENLVGTVQGTDLPEAVQKQLAAAVAKANKANKVDGEDEASNAPQPGPPNATSLLPNFPPTPDHASEFTPEFPPEGQVQAPPGAT